MEKTAEIPVGVVIRKSPGVNRWARRNWRAVAVLPGAGPAAWRVLRQDGDTVEYHAATVTLELHRAETAAYRAALATEPPSVWVILRPSEEPEAAQDVEVHSVTASPYDGQAYLDSGEEIVEAVPMPGGLVAWVREFVERHHVEETFKKRRRDRVELDRVEDGIGDARVRQAADVYRSPSALKSRKLQS